MKVCEAFHEIASHILLENDVSYNSLYFGYYSFLFSLFCPSSFRRAKAITANINADIEDYKNAINDLKNAYMLEPTDNSIQQELAKAKLEFNKIKCSGDKFKGIFKEQTEKISLYDEKQTFVPKEEPPKA